MTVRQVTLWVAICDGCARELGQGYGHRETYDTPQEADTATRVAGWHPGAAPQPAMGPRSHCDDH